MAKYKLTVKYSGVCELTLESAKKEVVSKEFDRYISSILDETQVNTGLKTDFTKIISDLSNAAKNPNKEAEICTVDQITADEACNQTLDCVKISDTPEKEVPEEIQQPQEVQINITMSEDILEEKPEEAIKEVQEPVPEQISTPETPVVSAAGSYDIVSLKDYIKNKNINNPLDEFVVGACYLTEIQNVKEFTLKQINSKLYPVFKRLADLGVIEYAKKRMLIETREVNGTNRYSINQNAWNYHNYDLVRH